MIEDEKIAKELIAVLNDCSRKLNDSIRLVQQKCSDEEFQAYRKGAGLVMGYIYTDVLAKIYHKHPSLEPPEIREPDPHYPPK